MGGKLMDSEKIVRRVLSYTTSPYTYNYNYFDPGVQQLDDNLRHTLDKKIDEKTKATYEIIKILPLLKEKPSEV